MNTDESRQSEGLNALTEKIIGCAYSVSNGLGCGFLEKVYENALAHELRKNKVDFNQQARVLVRYDGVVVGDYIADLIADKQVLIELKTVKHLDDIHAAQCINCLKETGLSVCLLMNFAKPRLELKRLMN